MSSRAPRPGERVRDVDWTSTLRASLLRRGQADVEKTGAGGAERVGCAGRADHPIAPRPNAPTVQPRDLRVRMRRTTERVFVLFLVDASDSMGAGRRLAVVKASVMALLQRAYQQRHMVGVIAFGGRQAQLLLRPTASVSLARRALYQLRPEGATPLADALAQGLKLLHEVGSRGTAGSKIVVLLSDGEANVPLHQNADPHQEVMDLLPRLKQQADELICIDTKTPSAGRVQEMLRFAEVAGGRYYGAEALSAGRVLSAVGRAESSSRSPDHPRPAREARGER